MKEKKQTNRKKKYGNLVLLLPYLQRTPSL